MLLLLTVVSVRNLDAFNWNLSKLCVFVCVCMCVCVCVRVCMHNNNSCIYVYQRCTNNAISYLYRIKMY